MVLAILGVEYVFGASYHIIGGFLFFFFFATGTFFPASGRVRDFYNVWVWYALSMELVLLAVGVSRELALSNLGVDAN